MAQTQYPNYHSLLQISRFLNNDIPQSKGEGLTVLWLKRSLSPPCNLSVQWAQRCLYFGALGIGLTTQIKAPRLLYHLYIITTAISMERDPTNLRVRKHFKDAGSMVKYAAMIKIGKALALSRDFREQSSDCKCYPAWLAECFLTAMFNPSRLERQLFHPSPCQGIRNQTLSVEILFHMSP